MRILILAAYFEPEVIPSSYLNNSKREALAKAGFEMILFTPMPTRGVSKEIRNTYKQNKYEEKFNGCLKVHRFNMFRESNHSVLRAFRYFCCNFIEFFLGLFTKDVDLISIASTPPTQGALAALLKIFKKVPVVYDLQDIFPDSLVNAGLTRKDTFLWKIGRKIENFTYKNVDKIMVISEDLKQNILDKGVPDSKIVIIHNWADEDAVVNIPRRENVLFDRFGLNREKYYITYCGNIGFTQNFDLLIEVAEELKSNKEIVFVLIGDGPYKPKIEEKISEMKLENFKLFPYQPYEYISQVFSLGDAGLLISKADIGKNSVPSKTWNIMVAEKPIIASFDIDSELCSIIKREDCGICVRPNDKDALKEGIIRLFVDRYGAKIKGQNGKKYIVGNLTKAEGLLKYLAVIKELTGELQSEPIA